jgi:hypothetical protein
MQCRCLFFSLVFPPCDYISPFSLVFPLYDYLHLVRFDVLRVRRSQESTGCSALPCRKEQLNHMIFILLI